MNNIIKLNVESSSVFFSFHIGGEESARIELTVLVFKPTGLETKISELLLSVGK